MWIPPEFSIPFGPSRTQAKLELGRRRRGRNGSRRKLQLETLERRNLFAGLISEVLVEPLFGNNDRDQYIELRGTPNSTIESGTYFVTVEGANSGSGGPGFIHSVIDVSSLRYGENGFLVIAQGGNPYTIDSKSTSLVSASSGFAGLPNNRWSDSNTLSDRLAFIFGSGTFMLIHSPTKPVAGSDVDMNDDGTLDGSAANWTVQDSVALHRGTSTNARSYGKITFAENSSVSHPVGTEIVVIDGGGYVARQGASTQSGAADWIQGNVKDDANESGIQYRFTFGTFGDPRPTVYSGRRLDHIGAYNFSGGASGAIVVDNDGSGTVSEGDTPISGVRVFADANRNGVIDDLTVSVVADDFLERTEMTNLFPNATLTVADSRNDNIGFVVRNAKLGLTTDKVLSSEGIPWFDDGGRLKVSFYDPAKSISIEAIGAESLRDSYARMEIYDKNHVLLDSVQSAAMRNPQRFKLSLTRSQADIAYAVIFTNNTFNSSSPFGAFDNLVYTYPEPSTTTDALGKYRLDNLPPANYTIRSLESGSGKVLQNTSGYALNVTNTQHITNGDFLFGNNRAPRMDDATFRVNENTAAGTVIGNLLGTDPDVGQTVSYTLLDAGKSFTIDSAGTVRRTEAAWNYEEVTSQVLRVRITDSFEQAASIERNVTFINQDVNEPPVVTATLLRVNENSTADPLGHIQAIDLDSGANGQIGFRTVGTDPRFSIDAETGAVRRLAAVLDYETTPRFVIPVEVFDHGAVRLSTFFDLEIFLVDINEAPSNLEFINAISVAESNPVNSAVTVAQLSITDDALGENSITLSGPDASLFFVENQLLRFKNTAPLNVDDKSTYSVTVSVKDLELLDSSALSKTFTLRITDVNQPPVALELDDAITTIAENTDATNGIPLGKLRVVDDSIGTTVFALSGVDASLFSVSGTDLLLKTTSLLNFESKSRYTVVVSARDPSLIGSTPVNRTVTVSLSDVNEAPTQLQLTVEEPAVTETNALSTEIWVASLNVVDDAIGNNVLSLSGTDASAFALKGNELWLKSGVLLDYESKSSLQVTVQAKDPGLPTSTAVQANYSLAIRNRPEVVSFEEVNGGTAHANVTSFKIRWDSEVNVASGAISLRKIDIPGLVQLASVVHTTEENKTISTITFTGGFTKDGALASGNYLLTADGTRVRSASDSSQAFDFRSNTLPIRNSDLAGVVDIVAPTTAYAGVPFDVNIALLGVELPQDTSIEYRFDWGSDGVVDETITRNQTFTESKTISASSQQTLSISAFRGATLLGVGRTVINVSPARNGLENWLTSLDVDRDNGISPLDVLSVINYLNLNRTDYVYTLDTNRSGAIDPLDVLNVINYLNGVADPKFTPFSTLDLKQSGGVNGFTNEVSISGKIATSSRELRVTLNGGNEKNVSNFVAADGSFAITDAALTALFGNLAGDSKTLSFYTKEGEINSSAADRRFKKVVSSSTSFEITAAYVDGNKLTVEWLNLPGYRYDIAIRSADGTFQRRVVNRSSLKDVIDLPTGQYQIVIDAKDGAGNMRQTLPVTVRIAG